MRYCYFFVSPLFVAFKAPLSHAWQVARNSQSDDAKTADAPQEPPRIETFFSKSVMGDDLGIGQPGWRRCLSNFSSTGESPLSVHEKEYDTVEHAFQAAKYLFAASPKETALKAAQQFESGGSIRTAVAAKSAGAKKGMQKLKCILDVAQWNEIADEVMRSALRARWECDSTFRTILQAVKSEGMTLLHHERSGAKSYWGGTVKEGTICGRNQLGVMLMELADKLESEAGLPEKRARKQT